METEQEPQKGEDNYEFLFANIKLMLENAIANSQEVMAVSKQGLQESIDLQKKINDQYLAREQQLREHNDTSFSQRLEHENEIETSRQENMRFTLKHLYGEAAEKIAQAVVDELKKGKLVVKE